jgi:hypothetical protein
MFTAKYCGCLVCGREPGSGFSGLLIKGCYICYWCEQAMLASRCEDESYAVYVSGVRKIWRCPVA